MEANESLNAPFASIWLPTRAGADNGRKDVETVT